MRFGVLWRGIFLLRLRSSSQPQNSPKRYWALILRIEELPNNMIFDKSSPTQKLIKIYTNQSFLWLPLYSIPKDNTSKIKGWCHSLERPNIILYEMKFFENECTVNNVQLSKKKHHHCS